MGNIIIENHKLTFRQIKEGQWPHLSPYFDEALLFCKDWLRGKENFELQTSGSTGVPKTISVHRNQMEMSASATRNFFNVPDGSDLLGCLNVQMIGGKMMLVRAMEWLANIYLVEPSSDPLSLFGPDQKFYFAAMVPMQLAASTDNPLSFQKLANIQNLIIGGAQINSKLKDIAGQLPIYVFQTFGMTETLSHIALAKIKTNEDLIYQALPGIKFSVTAENKLIVSAPMAKEESLITNDIVTLLSDTAFKWLGRADFTINSGGIKTQPEFLENQIGQAIDYLFPGKRFFIFGEKNENFGQLICLLVEQSTGNAQQAEILLNEIKCLVSKYLVPKKVYFLEPFEETASGKINRPATLKKLYS